MKRILALLLALCLVLCLAACGNEDTTSDITSDVSQTQSTTDTSSKNESTASSTESGTETSTSTPTNSETPSTTSKPTESSTHTTSTTSKPTETSKPTTSTTTKPTETHTHDWGWWKTETKALVGKDGTEARTCSGCKEVERRSTTKDALRNSFFNEYLQEYFVWCNHDGGNPTPFNIHTLLLVGDLIARDECWDGATATISVNDYYNAVAKYFVLSDNVINQMKTARGGSEYSVNGGGFTPGTLYYVAGYIHNGGKKYTVYYDCDEDSAKPIKVELEYNLLNGKPNRYISIEKVNSIPGNITE